MKRDEKQFDSRSSRIQRSQLIHRPAMDPLVADRELARSYLRGDHDEELFAQSSVSGVVAPKGAAHSLEDCAKNLGVLKLHGQRGLTAKGGLKLLEMVGEDVKAFPSFEEVMS